MVGDLSSGARFSNFMPYVLTKKGDMIVITQEGRCDFSRMGEGKVELKAEEKGYSDQTTELTCISVTPVK